jgi:hypothetical protein
MTLQGEDGVWMPIAAPPSQASRALCCGRDADVAEAEPPGGLGGALQIARKAQSSIIPVRGTIDAVGKGGPR